MSLYEIIKPASPAAPSPASPLPTSAPPSRHPDLATPVEGGDIDVHTPPPLGASSGPQGSAVTQRPRAAGGPSTPPSARWDSQAQAAEVAPSGELASELSQRRARQQYAEEMLATHVAHRPPTQTPPQTPPQRRRGVQGVGATGQPSPSAPQALTEYEAEKAIHFGSTSLEHNLLRLRNPDLTEQEKRQIMREIRRNHPEVDLAQFEEARRRLRQVAAGGTKRPAAKKKDDKDPKKKKKDDQK